METFKEYWGKEGDDDVSPEVAAERVWDFLNEKLSKINQWIDAYPLDIFPEPDFKKAARVLKENGMTLDAISASNMRHVLNGLKSIISA